VRELLFNITKHADVSQAKVSLARTDGLLRVAVSDAGKGFDPATLAERQASNGSFGLFSLKERLSMIGGVVNVTSAVGEGTQVEIVLPVEPQLAKSQNDTWQVTDAPTVASAGETGVRRMRVVVADDHALFREGLVSLIQQEPYIELVGTASDGEEAVEVVRQTRPDVLIVDVSMPKLNGIQVTQIVARELPATRVIGLSMHEREDMANAMRDAGAAAYCTKNSASDTLIAALRQANPVNNATA
jgi:CheY-like chemotaxis protein